MIKLYRTTPPAKLIDPKWIAEKKLIYDTDESSVWNETFIKKSLLKLTNYKCAYSECRLQIEGKYMEIDHFHPKEQYPAKILEWDNLIPSNKTCNTTKGAKDPIVYEIINPFVDNPKEHFYFNEHVIKGKTSKGKKSFVILGLNKEHFTTPRQEIRDAIKESLCNLYEDSSLPIFTTDDEIKFTDRLKKLIMQASPTEAYTALISTTIINDIHFRLIKKRFQDTGWWDEELETLETSAISFSFDISPE